MSKKKTDIEEWKDSVKKGNLQPDKSDERDYPFSKSVAKLGVMEPLPNGKDLRYLTPQIENQGNIGSCVAQACVNSYEILLTKSNNFYDLSRLFVYFIAREPWPVLCCKDKGANTRDGIKEVAKKGVPKETTWPYNTNKVNTKPPQVAYDEALNTKVERYERIFGFGGSNEDKFIGCIEEVKIALLRGFPVVFSMSLTNSFFSMGSTLRSQNYRGTFNDTKRGGHAMCIVGYDDTLDGFIVENSWSKNWGDNGYFLLKYDVAFKDVWDAWVITGFNGVLFEDEDVFERPFENFQHREYNVYKDTSGTYGNMECEVTGKNSPISYRWYLDSFTLSDAILRDRDDKTCRVRIGRVPSTLNGFTIIKDSKGNSIGQGFTINLLPGGDPVAEFTKRLYTMLLDREPDPDGMKYWYDELKAHIITGRGIVRSFFEQPETIAKNYSAEETIKRIYRVMLLREPDPTGFAFWVDAFNRTNGSIVEITKGFGESVEFTTLCAKSDILPY